MAFIGLDIEERTPILCEADVLETRLALDEILINDFVRELKDRDDFISPTKEESRPRH